MRLTKVAFAASAMFAVLAVPLKVTAQVVDGSGTTNVVPRWVDSNTLGNSNISVPGGVVTVTGQNGTAATPNAPTALRVTGGSGAAHLLGTEGAGGGIALTSGRGGFRDFTVGRRSRCLDSGDWWLRIVLQSRRHPVC